MTESTKAEQAAMKKLINEAIESMTGFDEIAVKQKFDAPLDGLLQSDRLQGLRALVFVGFRRDGSKDDQAFHQAQEMSIKDVNDWFFKKDGERADFGEQPPTKMP